MKHYFHVVTCLVKHSAAVLLCIASVSANAGDSADKLGMARAFAEAMAHYEQCKWSQAFADFAALADSGHAESARIAWLMARHGPKLFGGPRVASLTQIERWQRLSTERMSAVAASSD
ncbi:MAG: hypothetical protein H7293_13440 [Candidatus Saccharibacteria bacterium]|nr:hypothetical protein [Rhodoferax sp.]